MSISEKPQPPDDVKLVQMSLTPRGTGNQGREGEELGERSVIDSLRPEGTFCCASEELPPL